MLLSTSHRINSIQRERTMMFKPAAVNQLFGCVAVVDATAIAFAYLHHREEDRRFKSAAVARIRRSVCEIFDCLGSRMFRRAYRLVIMLT